MEAKSRIVVVGLLAACALLVAGAGRVGAAQRGAAATADYNTGLALGLKAYEYGIPLLDTTRIFDSGTSVTVCDHVRGDGPVNQLCSIRNLVNASERIVNAPNNDTLYSVAFLDISKQPMVLHAPPITDRFWEFELVDPWTNNFYNVTSAHKQMGAGEFNVTGGGNWAVVGPGYKGKIPHGVTRVDSPYDRVWVIGRTYVRGPSDLAAVHRIQNQYSVTPLSAYGTRYKPRRPRRIIRHVTETTIPGTQPGENPLDFYRALGRLMVQFPPPAADRPRVAELKAAGIGPGLDPAKAGLSADELRGLGDAVTNGQSTVLHELLQLYLREFNQHNGYVIGDLGHWGTNYLLRAVGDRVGVGGQRASIATYPFAVLDDTKAFLTGSNRYVLHIPKSSLPIPVKAFWSLTLYDSNSFFVPNPLNRYLINNQSKLRRNADGSIDIYIQHDQPTDPAQVSNWLPAPVAGTGFRLIWRLYDLGNAVTGVLNGSGWQPPRIEPCDASGMGNLGTPCAS
jgi:hypothetical protein